MGGRAGACPPPCCLPAQHSKRRFRPRRTPTQPLPGPRAPAPTPNPSCNSEHHPAAEAGIAPDGQEALPVQVTAAAAAAARVTLHVNPNCRGLSTLREGGQQATAQQSLRYACRCDISAKRHPALQHTALKPPLQPREQVLGLRPCCGGGPEAAQLPDKERPGGAHHDSAAVLRLSKCALLYRAGAPPCALAAGRSLRRAGAAGRAARHHMQRGLKSQLSVLLLRAAAPCSLRQPSNPTPAPCAAGIVSGGVLSTIMDCHG